MPALPQKQAPKLPAPQQGTAQQQAPQKAPVGGAVPLQGVQGGAKAPGSGPRAAVPDQANSALWEGKGPLAGLLLKTPSSGINFADDGLPWVNVTDAWGNPLILCLASITGQIDAHGQLPTLANQEAWYAADRAIMDTAKLGGAAPLSDDGDRITALGQKSGLRNPTAGPELIDKYRGDAYLVWNEFVDAKTYVYSNFAVGTAADFGSDTDGQLPYRAIVQGELPVAPYMQRKYLDPDCPYIDNVPVQVPVDPKSEAGKRFPGGIWVNARLNPWTRTACIIGLSFHGFGTQAAMIAQNAADWEALKSDAWRMFCDAVIALVGIVAVALGFPAGVALITYGIGDLIAGWYAFDATLNAQGDGIKQGLGPDSPIQKSAVPLGAASGILQQQEKNSQQHAANGDAHPSTPGSGLGGLLSSLLSSPIVLGLIGVALYFALRKKGS